MKFKFGVFNTIISATFMLAFLCLMFSYLSSVMYYPAMVLFFAGFVMLSVALLRRYLKQTWMFEEKQDAIVMELAMGQDGEKYVMQSAKQQKKQRRQQRLKNFDRLTPFLICVVVSCGFAYLLINEIIKLF